MPTNRKRTLRTRLLGGKLTPDELWYLEVGFILDGSRSDLDRDPRRALWELHQQTLMAKAQRPGWAGYRPWAYWQFDIGHVPKHEDKVPHLREHGLLSVAELAELDRRVDLKP
jgi:hypothetical protein